MDDRAQGELVESVDSYWSEWAREADLPTYGRGMDEEASDDINVLLVPEGHDLASSLGLGSDSGDIRMQTTNISQHHSSLAEGNSDSHSYPVLAIRPPATGTSSGGFAGVATCGIATANKDSGRGTLCSIEEPDAVQNCKTKHLFEAAQVSYHLKRCDDLLEKSWSERDDNRPRKKGVADDVLDQQWRTKFGDRVSDIYIDSCNLPSKRNHVSNSPLYFEQHATANTSNKRLDDAMFVDSCRSRSSCLHQTYSSDVIHERSKRNFQSDLSTDCCGFEPHLPMQCSYEVGKSAPEKAQQLMDDVSKTRNVMIDSSFNSLSGESFTSMSHGCSSPTSSHSLGRASTVLSKLCRTESVPTEQAHLVVKAMHYLSELFLFQSSSGPWDIRDEGYDVLVKSVIDNLSASLKRFQRGTERQKLPSSPPRPAQLFGKSTAQVKSERSEEPQIRSVQANGRAQSTLPHFSEERKRCLAQGDPNKVDSALFASDDVDSVGNDEMTQAIKKILIDNFDDEVEPNLQVQLFKNLWLEAEAALCSMKFKSSFKRVKMEIERLKSFQRDSSDNLSDMEKLLSLNPSSYSRAEDKSALRTRCHANQNTTAQCFPALRAGTDTKDVMARFNILKKRGFNSDAISARDKVECVSLENSKLGHNSNDVVARFDDLMGWDSNSNAMSAGDYVECVGPEDSKSQNLMEADGSTKRACAVSGLIEGISDHFPVKIPTNLMDGANASIMERLSILRQRDDGLASVNTQPRPKEAACLGSFVKKDYFSGSAEETNALSFKNSPAFLHQTANPADEMSTWKGGRAILEDDEAPQSHRIGGSSDSSPSSSDWEVCGGGDLSAEV